MRVKVILNPWSDRGRAEQLQEKVKAAGQKYGHIDLALTERPGQAKQLAQAAVDDGYDVVAAAGGDGTINEVVNGLVRGDKAQAKLGVIPIGSGNDFAYAMGVSKDPAVAVSRLFEGTPRRIDLARIEDDRGRYAILDNGVGIGIDATVSIQSQSITRIRGFAMYTLAALRTIAYYYDTPQMQVTVDGESFDQQLLMLAVGVGPRAGGGFLITPDANHDDGLLDLCVVTPMSRTRMLQLMLKAINGKHKGSNHVTMRQCRTITISATTPLPIHIDGEIFAYPTDNVRRVTITSLPQAIEVMV